ncbi:hypothetical protein CDAR_176721 [Caerostris darwini]|uniref:Uncharacterized protein n=1 Tax=Caerostris darwini TaxID=1538125 RepID=A0AAV4NPI5_9ARAC|nr:hypothetical protein CDAR_176721 [Caerostris darwini]
MNGVFRMKEFKLVKYGGWSSFNDLAMKRQPVNFDASELRTCRYPISVGLEFNCAILQRIQSLNIESPVSRVQLIGLEPSTYRNALKCFSELNNCLKLEGLHA